MDPLRFAKILVETGETCGNDRDFYHHAIEKRAAETRRDDESPHQAYVRILETPEGQLLHDAYKRAPVAPAPKQAPQDLVREPRAAGEASEELNRMAQTMAKEKKLTFQQAYARLWSDPSHADLRERIRTEERRASQEVSDQRWPIRAAERDNERDWRLGHHSQRRST
jgi:hypothetical protein